MKSTLVSLCRRHARRPRSNGFTLMELLIVMAIITILMLIAIPSYLNYVRYANETSAIKSIQTIVQAQVQYASLYPSNGFACSIQNLGGDQHSGPPTPTAAEILPADLASGIKSGYQFAITNCAKNTQNGSDRATDYSIVATPLQVGKTGNRTFCSDSGGTIKFDPTGGTNCTQSLGQ